MDWLNPPPQPKCQHCNLTKGEHRAQTFQCPAKWSRGRAVGYTHFLETVFAPKPAASGAAARKSKASTEVLPNEGAAR